MQPADWEPLADLFAARLPEFDAVYAVPGAEVLTAQVARIRGVPDYTASGFPAGSGEAALFTVHLQAAERAQQAVQAAQNAGWRVLVLGTAVERTNKGGRALLAELGVQVRAATQVADTPSGLVLERRTPDRWTTQAAE